MLTFLFLDCGVEWDNSYEGKAKLEKYFLNGSMRRGQGRAMYDCPCLYSYNYKKQQQIKARLFRSLHAEVQ